MGCPGGLDRLICQLATGDRDVSLLTGRPPDTRWNRRAVQPGPYLSVTADSPMDVHHTILPTAVSGTILLVAVGRILVATDWDWRQRPRPPLGPFRRVAWRP